ncbi:MAG: hypothetical protein JWN17_2483 [Frankiales bacterium]|nr:hypothetical protein [Frankiales bacterium]
MTQPRPVPQPWVPRVTNGVLAVFLLGFLAPAVTHLGGLPVFAAVTVVVLFCLPVLLVAVLCLCSAVRPGSLGRAARRSRAKRQARAEQAPEV